MRKPIIRGYEPPCTLCVRLEMEHGILVASKDPVVNNQTVFAIDRQEGENGSIKDGSGNIVANNDFNFDWQ